MRFSQEFLTGLFWWGLFHSSLISSHPEAPASQEFCETEKCVALLGRGLGVDVDARLSLLFFFFLSFPRGGFRSSGVK